MRITRGERALVTTLTKRMPRTSEYLRERPSMTLSPLEIHTLERVDILHDLRAGVYDVGWRQHAAQGLDMPEVSMVKRSSTPTKRGSLRSAHSLIRTIGRAGATSKSARSSCTPTK